MKAVYGMITELLENQFSNYKILGIQMNTFPQTSAELWVGILTHLLVLICSDCNELCFLKDVSAKGAFSLLKCHRSIICLHDMNPWLVLVHGIQDQLQ